jgi:hypothetical protein
LSTGVDWDVVVSIYFPRVDGNPWKREFEESNLPAAFQRLADTSELIKIERINRITEEPVAGIYDK